MTRRVPILAVILAALAILPACSDNDENNTMMGPGPSTETSFVRVGHLSPDAPAVDVWVDGARVLENVPFRAFSGYLELAVGTYNIQVTPAGATTPVVINADVTLAGSTSYTVVARGLLSDSSINATVLVDDRAPTAGNAELRFLHASPDAPAVDITLTDASKLFDSVAFTEDASISAPAGTYDLQVRPAGSSTVVLSFDDVALAAGTNYTVYAIGLLSDGSLDALVSVDAPGDGATIVDLAAATAEVRVGHLSPDAPNVDVYLDDEIVAALVNVPFQAVSGYLDVEARTYNVKVYATGTSTGPVIDADVTFLPSEAYTVAATGLLGSGDLSPIVLTDDRTPGTDAHVRFVHTSPDAPAVDIVVAAGGPTLFSATSFRGLAGYSPVGAGTYDLEVQVSQGGAVALSVPGLTLDPGTNYTIFAIGLVGDSSLAALPIVDTL